VISLNNPLNFQDLESILIDSEDGQTLLKNRLALNDAMRHNLVHLISKKFYNNGQPMGMTQFRVVAQKICEVFVHEDEATYLRQMINSNNRVDYGGKLVNGYKNFMKKMRRNIKVE
jgi:hypothetical protein